MTTKKINRILTAKPNLDGHWIGIIVVSKAFKEAGFEVIYGGNMTPLAIAESAVQEDVDLIGLSILTPGYMRRIAETIEELEKRDAGDVPIIVGGIIYEDDIPGLKDMGVKEVFRPGTPLDDIVEFVHRIELPQ